jgi:hypothetical protein
LKKVTIIFLLLSFCLISISFASGDNRIKILFLRNRDIFTINGDGSSEKKLTSAVGYAHPQFSPDGSKIIYTREFTDHYELWMLDLKNETDNKVTDGLYPVWLDNSSIYFFRPGKDPYHSDAKVNMKYGWVHVYKKNIGNNKEEEIQKDLKKGVGDVESVSPIDYCSQKNNIMFISGEGRGAGCTAAYDLEGNLIQLPDKLFSGVCFRDYNEELSQLLVSNYVDNTYQLLIVDLKNHKNFRFTDLNLNSLSHDARFADKGAKSIAIINQSSNLEILSDFATTDASTIHSRGRKVLTGSSDVVVIESIINDKIFYLRKVSAKDPRNTEYYLWSINMDGSSSKRVTKIDWSSVAIWSPEK